MGCNTINRFIVFAFALITISDLFVLFGELVRQRCDRAEERKKTARLQRMQSQIDALQNELLRLRGDT